MHLTQPTRRRRHAAAVRSRAQVRVDGPRLAKQPTNPEPAIGEPDTEQPDTEQEVQTVTSLGLPWNVIVWDDPVNLMSYVVYVFQKLFGFSQSVATRHMMEVHNEGKSLVASADREKAEFYVSRLHGYGLQATLEQAQDD